MTFSPVPEVILGLLVVYYLIGLIASTVTSWFTYLTQLRAHDLKNGLRDILQDSGKLEDLLNHPWIENLRPKKVKLFGGIDNRLVERIPAQTFARTLVDILAPSEEGKGTLRDLQEGIEALPDGKAKTQIKGLVNKGIGDIQEARQHFENWFNETMANIGSVYGQHARRVVFVVALVATLGANVDTVSIGRSLWEAPAKRAAAAARAQELAAEEPEQDIDSILRTIDFLRGIEIPLFWSAEAMPQNAGDWGLKLAGLAITTFAAAQGAPFWYDVLKRVRQGGQAAAGGAQPQGG